MQDTSVREQGRVVIAGARGFIGALLTRSMPFRWKVIALSRSISKATEGSVEYRQCELVNWEETRRAVDQSEYAVYLVHSMMPAARLSQGRFEDFDLLSAAHFARACAAAGVKQIVYLGGLMPQGYARGLAERDTAAAQAPLSSHLESRMEVEKVLGAYGVPLTTLRAGLILGAGGSSSEMLIRLVERLPVLLCPSWTSNQTQPIAAQDVVRLLQFCIGNPATFNQTFDIGGIETVTYRQMMKKTSLALDKRRRFYKIPIFAPTLSRLWVSLVTGAPRRLVYPLIESLRYTMIPENLRLQDMAGVTTTNFNTLISSTLQDRQQSSISPRAFIGQKGVHERKVLSVQRLPLPPHWNAKRVVEEYRKWLPRVFLGMIRVSDHEAEGFEIFLRPFAKPVLGLHALPSTSPDSQEFEIASGWLARRSTAQPGILEFLAIPSSSAVIVSIHNYQPRLPWVFYLFTQAIAHAWVMSAFGRYLARRGGDLK